MPSATQEATLGRLQRPETTREDFMREFATLTLGSGAAAAVLGPADEHPGAHRILGGVTRAGTQHHELCVGGVDGMFTDAKGLLEGRPRARGRRLERGPAGVGLGVDGPLRHAPGLVRATPTPSSRRSTWIRDKVPITFPRWGNVGPGLAPDDPRGRGAGDLATGDRVLCMGVGSGLNTAMMELAW